MQLSFQETPVSIKNKAFRPHFDALQMVGYFKIVKKDLSTFRIHLFFAYRAIMWIFILTYNLQHLIQLYKARHSADKMVDILFVLLTTLNTLGKQVTFNVRSHRIENLIRVLDGPCFAPTKEEHCKYMRLNAVLMQRLLKLFHFAIYTCAALWTIFPLVNRALSKDSSFSAYFPFDTEPSPIYQITLAYMSFLIAFQAYGNVTMDCTVVAFYAQTKIQLQILRDNLKHIVDDSESKLGTVEQKNNYNWNYEKNGYKDENKILGYFIQKRLVFCVEHYKQVTWFVGEVQSIFDEAMVIQFIVMAWVICMTVYKIVSLNLLSVEFVSMAVYLVCMLSQLFIYCYFGTQVKVESEFLNESLYSGDWSSLSPRFRRQLLVMMIRFSRPIDPRTAYIIPMSLDTYIAVLRSSYTLFTFLNRK